MLLTTTIATTMLLATPDTIDFDFEGGTLQSWATAVQAAAPHANIIMGVDASSVDLPPMHLEDVSLTAVMEICDTLSRWTTCIEVEQEGAPIWVIKPGRIDRSRSVGFEGGPRVSTSVFPIPEGFRTDEGAVRLIQAAQAVHGMGSPETLSIQKVPGVSLLAIHGTGSQIDLVADVIAMVDADAACDGGAGMNASRLMLDCDAASVAEATRRCRAAEDAGAIADARADMHAGMENLRTARATSRHDVNLCATPAAAD